MFNVNPLGDPLFDKDRANLTEADESYFITFTPWPVVGVELCEIEDFETGTIRL